MILRIEWSGLFWNFEIVFSHELFFYRGKADGYRILRQNKCATLVIVKLSFCRLNLFYSFIFFRSIFSLSPLLLLWDRQCFVSIGSDKRKTRISLICRWCASIYSFIQHSDSPDCVCVYVTSVFPLISNNCITYLRCWENISAAISILDFFLKEKKERRRLSRSVEKFYCKIRKNIVIR